MKKKIIIFANTLWFLEKFKFELIENLSNNYFIDCIFLRKGTSLDQKKIEFLQSKGVTFKKLTLLLSLKYIFKNFYTLISFQIKPHTTISNVIVFTIGPIVISSMIFWNLHNSTIIVLEGLGRVFSSHLIIFRFFKRLLLIFYKIYFKRCKYIVTLNYSDSTYLSELGIVSKIKIKTIPGTGLNTKFFDSLKIYKDKEPKYVDFIARLLPDKGFDLYINTKLYLNKFHPKFSKINPFRIITPQTDLDKISPSEKKFITSLGIELKPYLSNQLKYLKNSKAILLPTKYGEGLSRVVMESIYLGIPMLVTRNQGTEEVLPYDYKYFIKSFNPSTISKQLIEMVNDKLYFKDIYSFQKEFLKNNYSADSSTKSFLSLINA